MRLIKILLTLSLGSTALLGDYIVFNSKYSHSQLFRALSDILVHAAIGFISSILFFTQDLPVTKYASVCNIVLCTIISSLIDIDHAFVAKSFYLKDMTNLKQRGIFHCTTIWFIVTNLLILYSYITRKLNLYTLSFMLVIAYTSHHIRDANRRGLWMFPFGHTPPIDKDVYVLLITVLPHLYAFLYKLSVPDAVKQRVLDHHYSQLV